MYGDGKVALKAVERMHLTNGAASKAIRGHTEAESAANRNAIRPVSLCVRTV